MEIFLWITIPLLAVYWLIAFIIWRMSVTDARDALKEAKEHGEAWKSLSSSRTQANYYQGLMQETLAVAEESARDARRAPIWLFDLISDGLTALRENSRQMAAIRAKNTELHELSLQARIEEMEIENGRLKREQIRGED